MKLFLLGLLLSFSALATESSTFNIEKGKFHKGGVLIATPEQVGSTDQILIKMTYEIKKKDLVPVSNDFLKGTYEQKLPAMFMDERGYLELEKIKSMNIEDASVVHLGRVNLNGMNDAHLIQILPHNKKSEMTLVYHPTVSGLGWDQLKLILHTNLPLLGDYLIEGKLK